MTDSLCNRGTGSPDESLHLLTLVAEALASGQAIRSAEVLACVFDTLHALNAYRDSAPSEVDFVQQLLLTALDKAFSSGLVSRSVAINFSLSHDFSAGACRSSRNHPSRRIDRTHQKYVSMNFSYEASSDVVKSSSYREPPNLPTSATHHSRCGAVGFRVGPTQRHAYLYVHGIQCLPPRRFVQLPRCAKGKCIRLLVFQ